MSWTFIVLATLCATVCQLLGVSPAKSDAIGFPVKTKNADEFTALMNRGRAYLDVRAAARSA